MRDRILCKPDMLDPALPPNHGGDRRVARLEVSDSKKSPTVKLFLQLETLFQGRMALMQGRTISMVLTVNAGNGMVEEREFTFDLDAPDEMPIIEFSTANIIVLPLFSCANCRATYRNMHNFNRHICQNVEAEYGIDSDDEDDEDDEQENNQSGFDSGYETTENADQMNPV